VLTGVQLESIDSIRGKARVYQGVTDGGISARRGETTLLVFDFLLSNLLE
jgi:hypothetical protein